LRHHAPRSQHPYRCVNAQRDWNRRLRCGAAPISLFDAEAIECRIAAEVKDFRGEDFLPAQELLRVGRSVPLLIAAAQEALAQADVCWRHQNRAEKQSWGVVIGSGGGTPDFTAE